MAFMVSLFFEFILHGQTIVQFICSSINKFWIPASPRILCFCCHWLLQVKLENHCFSRALLQPLLDVELDNETFPYATTKLVKAAGHLCRAIRISFVGEMGWELHIPWDSCLPVYKALWAQGVKHGLRHAGYRALSSLSSEKGRA